MNRKRLIMLALVGALVVPVLSACAPAGVQPAQEVAEPFGVTVTDGLGNEVTLDAKPVRIASATLGTDEILLDLVEPERLVALTYLAADEAISNVAGRPELAEVENVVEADAEQILALEPDLVFVASFTDPAVLEQLDNSGLPVFVVGFFTSIDAMKDNILTIGKLVGETEKAGEMVAEMDARLDEVAAVIADAGGEPPRVLYLSNDGWVGGSETTVDDVITRAGGVNVAADLVDWAQVNEETIIEMDPDVVILSTYVTDGEFIENPAFADLSAIKNGRVYQLIDSHVCAVSQYIVLGVEDLARSLYPELFEE
jgi:iron complex transport system substrate-binding protein